MMRVRSNDVSACDGHEDECPVADKNSNPLRLKCSKHWN